MHAIPLFLDRCRYKRAVRILRSSKVETLFWGNLDVSLGSGLSGKATKLLHRRVNVTATTHSILLTKLPSLAIFRINRRN